MLWEWEPDSSTPRLCDVIQYGIRIFDDSWNTYIPEHKAELCQKILDRYRFYHICCEAPDRFVFYINEQLRRIMPYYNQLYASELIQFNPMLNHVLNTNNRSIENVIKDIKSGNTRTAKTVSDFIRENTGFTQGTTQNDTVSHTTVDKIADRVYNKDGTDDSTTTLNETTKRETDTWGTKHAETSRDTQEVTGQTDKEDSTLEKIGHQTTDQWKEGDKASERWQTDTGTVKDDGTVTDKGHVFDKGDITDDSTEHTAGTVKTTGDIKDTGDYSDDGTVQKLGDVTHTGTNTVVNEHEDHDTGEQHSGEKFKDNSTTTTTTELEETTTTNHTKEYADTPQKLLASGGNTGGANNPPSIMNTYLTNVTWDYDYQVHKLNSTVTAVFEEESEKTTNSNDKKDNEGGYTTTTTPDLTDHTDMTDETHMKRTNNLNKNTNMTDTTDMWKTFYNLKHTDMDRETDMEKETHMVKTTDMKQHESYQENWKEHDNSNTWTTENQEAHKIGQMDKNFHGVMAETQDVTTHENTQEKIERDSTEIYDDDWTEKGQQNDTENQTTHAVTNATGKAVSSNTENQAGNDTSTAVSADDKQENTTATTDTGTNSVITGYINISGSALLEAFRKTFLNIDEKIIDDLSENFMSVF